MQSLIKRLLYSCYLNRDSNDMYRLWTLCDFIAEISLQVQLCRYIVDVHNCCKDALSISLIILYDSCDYWENEIEKIIPKMPKIISLRNQRNHREIKAIHRRICQFITFISCADEFFKVFTKIFQLVF